MSYERHAHPTAPATAALYTEVREAEQSDIPELREHARVRLNEYMEAAIAAGECPCCRLPLNIPVDERLICPVCGHIWVRDRPGALITWMDAGELQASAGRSGSPGEAGRPYEGTHRTPGQCGKDAGRER
jgi:hypothetical protein